MPATVSSSTLTCPPVPQRSGRALSVLVAGAAALAGAFVLPTAGNVEAARVVHVSSSGSDSANGSASTPVRTVKRAVQLAQAGDTVQIGAGTYHEEVQVYAKQVHLAGAPGATVIFDGARPVTDWTRSGNVWAAQWNTDFSRAGAPHTTAERPEAGWPEQFFVDGIELVEVTSSAAVTRGTFFHDRSAGQVVIGTNPAGRLVEGSDLAWGVYLNKADGSSLSNITVRRYATPTAKMAAIRGYANNLLIENVTIEDNAYMGVSVMGNNIELNGIITRDNGHLGAHAHRTDGLTMTDSVISGNNAEQFDPFHAAGGFKMTESSNIKIVDSTVDGNSGPGIWTDLDTTDIVLTGNTVTNNTRSGIELELSARAVVADNIVTGNAEAGVWVLESSDVEIWHNALFDNFRDVWVEDGPRSDVQRVAIVNNTMGGIGRGAPAILNVDDWTSDRSAEEMKVTLGSNRYWLPTGSTTAQLSRWANWPYGVVLSSNLAEHQAVTSQDADAEFSTATTNPFVRSTTDHRPRSGTAAGRQLSPAVAAALGVAQGSYAAGIISDTTAPPATTPTTTPSTTSATTTPATTTPATTTPATTAPTTAPATTTATTTATSTTTATTAPTTTPTTTTAPASTVPATSLPATVPATGAVADIQVGTALSAFDTRAGNSVNAGIQPAVRGANQQRLVMSGGFMGSMRFWVDW